MLAVLVAGLAWLVYITMTPFLPSIVWAAVLARATWPLYRRLQSYLPRYPTLSALLAALFVAFALIGPLLWLAVFVHQEITGIYLRWQRDVRPSGTVQLEPLRHIPWFGEPLQNWLAEHLSEPAQLHEHLTQWLQSSTSYLLGLLGSIGRNAAKLAITLVMLFLFYRNGEVLAQQIRTALHKLGGRRIDTYLDSISKMSAAILQGVLLAATLQGLIAGLGYWVIGAGVPVLLGLATAFASIIPFFGTALVWVPVAVTLLMAGFPWSAAAMVLWGIVFIHPIDNIVRPLLISSSVKIPFLVTAFGVFGGVHAFGLIGIFLGPAIMATALAIWQEWVAVRGDMPGTLPAAQVSTEAGHDATFRNDER